MGGKLKSYIITKEQDDSNLSSSVFKEDKVKS